MEQNTIPLGQRPARVWTGGTGEAIVLLHGGWGGAEAHWSRVTDELEAHHRVIAPELPGFGATDEPALASFGAYAAWLKAVLDGLGVDRATIVGNALGATVGWRFASDHPERCNGLVMVNGFPPPLYHRAIRWLVRHTFLGNMARTQLRDNIFGPGALRTGFHDQNNVPPEIRRMLSEPHPERMEGLLGLLVSDEKPCPPPKVPTLLLFGEADRVPLVDSRSGRRFGDTLDESQLVRLPGAGHLPQVEQPADFVRTLRRFVDRRR